MMNLSRNLAAALGLGLAGCAVAATHPTGQWHVESIGGRDVIDGSDVTLNIAERGSVGGSGGCNSYTAAISADGFEVGPVTSTMMACDEPLMTQERRFFEALDAVSRYERGDTGALLLFTADGADPVIVARQTNR